MHFFVAVAVGVAVAMGMAVGVALAVEVSSSHPKTMARVKSGKNPHILKIPSSGMKKVVRGKHHLFPHPLGNRILFPCPIHLFVHSTRSHRRDLHQATAVAK